MSVIDNNNNKQITEKEILKELRFHNKLMKLMLNCSSCRNDVRKLIKKERDELDFNPFS